ncbi:MAG: hypothetical protein ACFFAU_15635 [Candidatus Hodarchaeota archaeon]
MKDFPIEEYVESQFDKLVRDRLSQSERVQASYSKAKLLRSLPLEERRFIDKLEDKIGVLFTWEEAETYYSEHGGWDIGSFFDVNDNHIVKLRINTTRHRYFADKDNVLNIGGLLTNINCLTHLEEFTFTFAPHFFPEGTPKGKKGKFYSDLKDIIRDSFEDRFVIRIGEFFPYIWLLIVDICFFLDNEQKTPPSKYWRDMTPEIQHYSREYSDSF